MRIRPSRIVLSLLAVFTNGVAACGDDSAIEPTHADAGGAPDASLDALPDGSDAGDSEVGPPTCLPPNTLCGGYCVDPTSDLSNCGSCGYVCVGGETCCGGSCSTDCTFSISSLSHAFGPLSGGTWVTIQGTGFAPGARVFFGESRAPAMVIDSTTIRAQTSPHLAGKVDVRVEQGVARATRGKAFEYAVHGFEGPWQTVSMSSPRGAYPGVSVLLDGRVLITGGRTLSNNTSLLATADLYDAATNTTAPTAGNMAAARVFVTQTTLLTGKVLVLGTDNIYSAVPNAELFDPTTSEFVATAGQPVVQQNRAFATMLTDGRVLVTSQTTPGALVYDPMGDSFAAVPGAPNSEGYEPVRLLDGRVLLVAGAPSAPAFLFDPDSGQFTAAGPSPAADASTWIYRGAQRAFVVPDGRVLSIGGYGSTAISIFDPASPGQGFSPASYALSQALHYATITGMGDGTLLVIGGATVATGNCAEGGWTLTDRVERIDPETSSVALFDALPDAAMDLGAVTLLDGSVIAGGGEVCGGQATHPFLYFLKGRPPAPK